MRRVACSRVQASALVLLFLFLLSACTVGPNYSPEPAPVPTTYKNLKGWKFANPNDAADRGDWWAPYRDSRLAALLREVEISNQTVAAAAAAYEQSRAILREAQAALFPVATAGYNVTRTRTGALAGISMPGRSARSARSLRRRAGASGGSDSGFGWSSMRA